jgi:hypothetical protein
VFSTRNGKRQKPESKGPSRKIATSLHATSQASQAAGWLVSAPLKLPVIGVPFLQPIFNTPDLVVVEWLVVVGLALTPAFSGEFTKLYLRTRDKMITVNSISN